MQVAVRHQPAFAVARLTLASGESVKAESGSMAAMSQGINIEAKMEGGLFKALKRSALGGESFFVTTYSSTVEGGWVDVAANLPGDIAVMQVEPGRGLGVTRGSWLGHESSVEMDTKWGGANNLFGGEGGFVAHMTGSGQVVVGSYGALDLHELQPGQGFTVDSGHLVAYDDSIGMKTRTVSGLMTSMKSGEGLVVDMTGPGRVWTQSRNPGALVQWLTTVLPFTRA
ncbi:MAG: hypothetical protein QG661_769 [Actinomycetota bacterium]|jgi:uncharacterized protein (TIGR00266 family)|nr:hypothetical protein [Actinomycetota bacterium]